MIVLRSFMPSRSWPSWGQAKPRSRPRLEDYPRATIEKLRFADTDKNGHISHAVFAVCCQNARMELLHDRIGPSLPQQAHFAIARLELDFLGEMRWPADVLVGTRIDRVGERSFTVGQGLFVDGRCVGQATSIVVLVDATTRRSVALPLATKDALVALIAVQPVRPITALSHLKQRLGWAGRL